MYTYEYNLWLYGYSEKNNYNSVKIRKSCGYLCIVSMHKHKNCTFFISAKLIKYFIERQNIYKDLKINILFLQYLTLIYDIPCLYM